MRDKQYVTIEIGSGKESAAIALTEFSPEILMRFSVLLQREVKLDSALDLYLRTVALSYKAQKNDADKTEHAAKRYRQRKAAKSVQKALDAIDQLHTGDVLPFVIEGGDEAYNKFRALTRLLECWSPFMATVAKRRLPRGREESDLLTNSCGCLKAIYEEYSGQIATHNTMLEGVDAGKPLSPFGQFAVTFFKYVDPAISPGDLREPLARAVWPSRKK